MKTHTLKTDPEMFRTVYVGTKTFEIRFDDRNYQEGDVLVLLETKWSGQQMKAGMPLVFTGYSLVVEVTHVLRGPIYGLKDGWVLLSFKFIYNAAS